MLSTPNLEILRKPGKSIKKSVPCDLSTNMCFRTQEDGLYFIPYPGVTYGTLRLPVQVLELADTLILL
jgi:hypothetical protein